MSPIRHPCSPITTELKIFRIEDFFLRQDLQRASHTMEVDEVDSLWGQRGRAIRAGAPNDNFRKNICSESRIFETFVVKFLACNAMFKWF